MNLLQSLEKDLKNCVKCGACRAHCPVFSHIGREPSVARGKVALAKAVQSGSIELNDRTYADMSLCLLCGSCVDKCPNDVPTDRIIIAAREALAKKRGLTSFHTAVRHVLRNPSIMNAGAFLAALLNPLFFRRVPSTSGLRLRFPVPFVPRKRHFPKVAAKPFLRRYPEVLDGSPGKPRVVYFVGCMTNFVYPGIGEAAVAILREMECTVIIPKAQGCCGFPAMSGGDMATVSILAEKNLAALEKYQADYVVTACASCGSALRDFYPDVVSPVTPKLAGSIDRVAERVIDAAVLLQRLGFEPKLRHAGKITYHDPCHLRRVRVTKEPRALLASAAGADFVEMEDADSCCGLGGTFSAYHYRTSMAINDRKSASIARSGASIVATGCPGCMFQIADGLQQKGMATRVRHILEILSGGESERTNTKAR